MAESVRHFQSELDCLTPEEEGTEAAWDREIDRRVAEIHDGRAVGKPADKVFAQLNALNP